MAKEQMMNELVELRQRVVELETSEAGRKQVERDLVERVKELRCLYGVSQLMAKAGASLDQILKRTVDLIPDGWQYPKITCARATFDGKEFKTDNFRVTEWKQSSVIKVNNEKLGVLEVYYLEEKPEIDEGPFLKEERNLIKGLTRVLGQIAECKKAEEETHLLLVTTQAIGECQDFQAALRATLAEVCKVTSWHYGEAWIPSHDGKILECSPAWYSSTNSLQKFRKFSEGVIFPPNTGLPGRVWSSKQPEWISDVSKEPEAIFLRAKIGLESGLKAGFGVPIIVDGQVLAVFVFLMFKFSKEDNRLVRLVSGVATQWGSMIRRKQVEKALEKSEERYRTLFNSGNDAKFVHCPTPDGVLGKFINVNDYACKMLGYTRKELAKLSPSDISVPDKGERATPEIMKELFANKHAVVEASFVSKDGRHIPVEASIHLFDLDGRPTVLTIVRDITERKKMEREIKLMALFAEMNPAPVMRFNEEGKVTMANKAAQEIFSRETLKGLFLSSILSDIGGIDPASCIKDGKILNHMIRIGDHFFNFVFRGITDSCVGQIYGSDITELIKIQKEQEKLVSSCHEQSKIISDSNVKLEKALDTVKESEDELQQLYQQEKGLRSELQAEIKKRSDFTRALVHELKTPLVPIIASSDMLVDGLKDEPWLSMAKNIERGATNLSQRVDELLDIARGEVGILKVNLKAIDPLPLLREVAEEMGAVASHREQSLFTDLPSSLPLIQADYSRLRQVLLNLLNNASKFTPSGGEISLRTKEKDGTMVVEVQDTGPGIPEQEQRRIFDPYYQLATEGQQFKGLGIGLSLCKQLVELHGGQIAVESKAGKGSIFRFSVPLAPSDRQAKGGSNTGVTKILIIEDDREVVTAISLALQVYWPEVKLVSTHLGETGIQMVKDEALDAIILDLELPDISGFQVLSQIRLLSYVPVVILTSSVREGDRIKGFEFGANDYIVKPFKQRELIERLKAQVAKTVSETVKSTI